MMTHLKVPITTEDHIKGNERALITLVEYGDFQCPSCGRAYLIVKRIQNQFGDQLRFVFRNFPLTKMHPLAEMSAETAEFASDHGKFWEMHDLLYENQESFSPSFFLELVEALRLPVEELQEALQNKSYETKVKNDFIGGVRSGVNGTPTFFIDNERYNGSFEDLETVIQALILK
jgi:protein-disulfide isomerase